MIRGKFRAEINFQQKTYYLGTYTSLERASSVRKQAEQLLHKDFLQFYEKWKQKADSDPIWKEENPISISVQQKKYGDFKILMLPIL